MTDECHKPLRNPTELTVAVVSDLHAYERHDDVRSDEYKPSFYCIQDDPTGTPIGMLDKLITNETLRADVLLCGGDLGDQAHPSAIRHAWAHIHDIGKQLDVHLVAGTVGNHDVDSRYAYSDSDPKGHLQALIPPFPLANVDQNDRFWSRNFEVVEHPAYRLVVLNSCAFHGGQADEFRHGRISDYTLRALRAQLESTANRKVNLLLCHHHPHKHMEIKLGEYDEMLSGQLLIDLLGSGEYGDWILIHGHKHHPKLCYAQGGSTAPVIFSAGSLCHVLFPELADHAARQFYLLRFPIVRFGEIGFCGTIQAWDWQFASGWGKPSSKYGLQAHNGFGHKTNLTVFANTIAQWIGHLGRVAKWTEFLKEFPHYEYLLPHDAANTIKRLTDDHRIRVHYENDEPIQIGVAT